MRGLVRNIPEAVDGPRIDGSSDWVSIPELGQENEASGMVVAAGILGALSGAAQLAVGRTFLGSRNCSIEELRREERKGTELDGRHSYSRSSRISIRERNRRSKDAKKKKIAN